MVGEQVLTKGISWGINDEGILTIIGDGKIPDFETNENKPSAPWARYKDDISSINVMYGITDIGANAFRGLTNVEVCFLGETVKTIGEGAFHACDYLYDINFPNSLTEIKDYAFAYSGVSDVNLPRSVKTLGQGVFVHCINLETLRLSNGMKTVPPELCYNCIKLWDLKIPDCVSNIKREAFRGCVSLYNVTFPSDLGAIGSNAFRDSGLRVVTLPDKVKSIGQEAFAFCSRLKQVHMSDNVQKIGKGAFSNCSELDTVRLSNKLEAIPKFAFSSTNLSEINIPESVQKIDKSAFILCNNLKDKPKAIDTKNKADIQQKKEADVALE